jgi:hypothetical protein
MSWPNLWFCRVLFSARGPWERRAPGLPCALCLKRAERHHHGSGRSCRENGMACSRRSHCILNRHHPRRRMIPYAAAVMIEPRRLWNIGSSAGARHRAPGSQEPVTYDNSGGIFVGPTPSLRGALATKQSRIFAWPWIASSPRAPRGRSMRRCREQNYDPTTAPRHTPGWRGWLPRGRGRARSDAAFRR